MSKTSISFGGVEGRSAGPWATSTRTSWEYENQSLACSLAPRAFDRCLEAWAQIDQRAGDHGSVMLSIGV